jgi:hypothetical protein
MNTIFFSMGSSVREPRISGSSNTLQGVRESVARAITLQVLFWKWMEATHYGVEGPYPAGVSRPHVRRDNFVPSVLELGIPLGGWEKATSKN